MIAGSGRRVGRPPLTDPTALLAAARSIGFAGLTVGTVTAAAGVKYSTFYRHFPKLDALTTALVDQLCADLAPPDPQLAWQDAVRDACTVLREMFEQHPGMAEAVTALPRLPDGILGFSVRLTDALTDAGHDIETAAAGAVCAVETVTMTQLNTAALRHALEQRQLSPGSGFADAGSARTGLWSATEMIGRSGAWTDQKIELLIRGLEADLSAGPASSR